MMVRFYTIICILCCLLSCSCVPNKRTDAILHEAAQMLMQHPDSTLQRLSQIPEPGLLKGKEQAQYCLLYAAAKFRNYETQSDSMITIAANYYEKHGNTTQKTEAYYYMGCIAEDLEEIPRAQKYYRLALETGKERHDYSLSGRIASRIAMLYTYQHLYKTSMPYYEQALEYYRLADDKPRQSIVLRNIGRNYTMMQESDSAVAYYEKALCYATTDRQAIVSELGDLYITTGNYEKAFEYIRLSLHDETNKTVPYHSYLSYGKLFYHTNQPDSAIYYLQKCLDSRHDETRMDAYAYLANIQKDKKNWEAYIQLQERYEQLSEQIHARTHTEAIMQMEHLYNYQSVERSLAEATAQNVRTQRIVFICIITILLLSILLFIGLNHLQTEKKEKQLQKQRFDQWKAAQVRNSMTQIEQNKRYIRELENRLANRQISGDEMERLMLEKERIDIENRKIEHHNKERQQQVSRLRKMEIYRRFHTEEGFKATSADWEALIALLNETYPLFVEQLQSLLPTMSDIEFKVCCLVKIEVPTTNIATIINRSRQSATMIRKRLYLKIYGENGSTKDFDDFIAGL